MAAARPTHFMDIQENVFRRWVNDYLSERGMKVESLKDGLTSGLALINLLEVISGKSLGRYNRHPIMSIQRVENIGIALRFVEREGLKLVNVGPEDIAEGNTRITLGLIWTLILRWEICGGVGEGESTGVDDLLRWINEQLAKQGRQVAGFTGKDWSDGTNCQALANALRPDVCKDWAAADPSRRLDNCRDVLREADEKMGVDQLLAPDEMSNPKVDKLAMMTYLAQYRNLKPVTLASRVQAYGKGLREAIKGEEASFVVEYPRGEEPQLAVEVSGCGSPAPAVVRRGGDEAHLFDVTYTASETGIAEVTVREAGEHIPGSAFVVHVIDEISLGGEGKIRCFFSSTSGSQKVKGDFKALTSLLEAKKVHLRPDFEPFAMLDVMAKPDRDAVFAKAGTRTSPLVFIDDKYVGGYDEVRELEETGRLDQLLNMDQYESSNKYVTLEEHMIRLKGMSPAAE